jgi:hypothetical protein
VGNVGLYALGASQLTGIVASESFDALYRSGCDLAPTPQLHDGLCTLGGGGAKSHPLGFLIYTS